MVKTYVPEKLQVAFFEAVDMLSKRNLVASSAHGNAVNILSAMGAILLDLDEAGPGLKCQDGIRAKLDGDGRLYFFREEEPSRSSPEAPV